MKHEPTVAPKLNHLCIFALAAGHCAPWCVVVCFIIFSLLSCNMHRIPGLTSVVQRSRANTPGEDQDIMTDWPQCSAHVTLFNSKSALHGTDTECPRVFKMTSDNQQYIYTYRVVSTPPYSTLPHPTPPQCVDVLFLCCYCSAHGTAHLMMTDIHSHSHICVRELSSAGNWMECCC